MSDPLGLTEDERERSDLFALVQDLAGQRERNLQVVRDLPPGTVIHMSGWGGPYPVMTREEWLQFYG